MQCQKVLSQSLKNEMSLTIVTGPACRFGTVVLSSKEMVLYELKMKVDLVFIISLFEIDISVHITHDV